MTETWKDIKGYEGLYQVSNCGNVFGKRKEIKQFKDKGGYLKVTLTDGNKLKSFGVHRLVAQAFIPNPDNLPQVNHKDENKENNCVDNLEWCTAKYNSNYGTRNRRKSQSMINGKKAKTVYQYSIDGQFIREWPSLSEIQRQLGFFESNICKCTLGQRKTAYGYIWKY